MRSGTAYELQTLARPISETESGWWPTPTTQDAHNNGGPSQHKRNSLALNTLIQYLPTPRAAGAKGMSGPDFAKEDRVRPDGKRSGGDDLVTFLERIRRSKPRKSTMHSGQLSLGGESPPDPSPSSPTEPPPSGALLNPSLMEWMQGFPAGWTAVMHSAILSARSWRKSSRAGSAKTPKRASKTADPEA